MRYSHNLIKSNKEAREFDTINATLLQKGAFIDQTMAGVFAFLPLGLRVLQKIEQIIREEMDTIGAEIFLPALVPTKLWEQTGRFETVDVLFKATPANAGSAKRNDATYVLNSTHEDTVAPIAGKYMVSYRDLPFAVYQIQTKFRNEERPKSGLLRGREFRMKDLYSFHASDEDRESYYDKAKEVYVRIFERLGLGVDTVIALASGGDFTDDYSHEFQTKLDTGEDTIYHDEKDDVFYNKEVASPELQKATDGIQVSEVGNIFPLGTKFTKAAGYTYTNESGKQQPVYMASYGIGSSRIMGVLVEKFHDDRGIIWPASVAPFTVHLVSISGGDDAVTAKAETVYEKLLAAGVEVLYDDRADVSPGEKLGDADLVGCPWRAIVSGKTGDSIEIKERTSDAMELVTIDDFITQLS